MVLTMPASVRSRMHFVLRLGVHDNAREGGKKSTTITLLHRKGSRGLDKLAPR